MNSLLPYISSESRYYREARESVPAGGTVYLEPHVAKRYMDDFPGLLKPALVTAQAHPVVVRGTESRKPKRRKAKA